MLLPLSRTLKLIAMMGHPSDDCDGDGVSMDATLLISANSSSSGKYGRIWRRYWFVFRISLSIRKFSRQSGLAIGIDSDAEDEQSKADEQSCSPEDILRIVKERDIVSLRAIGGVEKAVSILASNGASPSRLLPRHRLALRSRTLLCRLVKACSSFTILLLLICAGLSFAVEIIEQGPQHGWHDGVAILVTVFLLVTIRCFSKFRCKKNELKVQVRRNEEFLLVPISGLLRGDVVVLSEGDVVPADGLFAFGDTLDLDDKSKIDRFENPFLLCGSEVTRGHGGMLVITLLAARVHKPNSYIELVGLAVSVVIAFVVLVGLICRRPHNNDDILPELKGSVIVDGLFKIFENTFFRPRSRIHVLTGSLAAFLIGMQHGMPFAITVSLSFWNWEVEFGGAKPRNLTACGTMGLVTVICVNATGGLICDKMEVKEFFVGREDMCLSVDPMFDQVFLKALSLGIHLPETSICPANDVAVADWVKSKLGSDMELSDECFSVVDLGRSRSSPHCSRVVIKENRNGGIMHMHLKGDASTIVNLCSHYYDRTGQIHSIEDSEGIHCMQIIENMKRRGLKTFAFACKQVETAQSYEEGSHLLAVIGLSSVNFGM